MNINELIGKRILVAEATRYYGNTNSVEEYKVLEISPSESWVKLMNRDGRKFWKATTSISVVEVLKDLERCPETKG